MSQVGIEFPDRATVEMDGGEGERVLMRVSHAQA